MSSALVLSNVHRMMSQLTIKKKRAFTLLEVLLACALLTLGAGAFAISLYKMAAHKRFTSDAERLFFRFLECRRLALNMQADWEMALTWDGKNWLVGATCVESPKTPPLAPLTLDAFTCVFNKKEATDLHFLFTATGEVLPAGKLVLSYKDEKKEWTLPEAFALKEGEQGGPTRAPKPNQAERDSLLRK